MTRTSIPHRSTPATIVITIFVAIAALRLARAILIPIALAVLLSFLLAPLVGRLQRWGTGRVAAVILVALSAFAFIGGFGLLITGQVTDLADNIPQYKHNIRDKFESARAAFRGGISRAIRTVEEIEEEMSEMPTTMPGAEPVPEIAEVTLIEPRPTTLEIFKSAIVPFLAPLGMAGVVIVFVIFILLYREDLRDRLIRLIGRGQIQVTTTAFDDAGVRVSHYLLMHSLINGCQGVAVSVGLFFLGVPNFLLWGLLSALLRFIPYVGPWIAASMPILLSLAVFEGWAQPLMVIGFFIVLELLSNNVLEPWLYGSGTGLSPLAVIFSAVFWTWLWGTMGLFLSTPLTVCLLVLGKHVPKLDFLSILLGDEPVLDPQERVYQRLLALDQEGAMEAIDLHLKDHSLLDLYDNVLMPALALAEQDRHRGDLAEEREKFILKVAREIVEELSDRPWQASRASETPTEEEVSSLSVMSHPDVTALCLPARDEADELCALMLSQILEKNGIKTVVIPVTALAGEMVAHAAKERTQWVCVSALPPAAATHARYLCKRLRNADPMLKIVVGLWTMESDPARAAGRLGSEPEDLVVSLSDALQRIKQWMQNLPTAATEATPTSS